MDYWEIFADEIRRLRKRRCRSAYPERGHNTCEARLWRVWLDWNWGQEGVHALLQMHAIQRTELNWIESNGMWNGTFLFLTLDPIFLWGKLFTSIDSSVAVSKPVTSITSLTKTLWQWTRKKTPPSITHLHAYACIYTPISNSLNVRDVFNHFPMPVEKKEMNSHHCFLGSIQCCFLTLRSDVWDILK